MAWLTGWAKRIEITVNDTYIDSNLTHYPIPIFVNSSAGTSNTDLTPIFDEVGANYQKIALTKSDGETQLYVEVEKWDNTGEDAVLWVSKSDLTINATGGATLYIYYDNTQSDNTTYIGDVGGTVAQSVWDSNFLGVYHLHNNVLLDSTGNNNDATNSSSTNLSTAKVAGGRTFSGSSQYVDTNCSPPSGANQRTIQAWIDSDTSKDGKFISYGSAVNGRAYEFTTETISTVDYVLLRHYGGNIRYPGITIGSWGLVHTIVPSGATTMDDVDVYIDGVARTGTRNAGSDQTLNTTASDLNVGMSTINNGAFDGDIDEVRISDIARSSAWVKADYYFMIDQVLSYGSEETEPASGTYSNGYSYRRQITIDSDLVIGSSNYTDFTIPFKGTYLYLADTSNGGKVTSSSGNDIRFELSDGTKLNHDLTYYNNTTGEVEIWIKIPTLYYSTDTVIYVYYGKSSASAEEDKVNSYSSDISSVYHLNESGNGTTGEYKDSKGTAHGTGGNGTSSEVPSQTTGATGITNQAQTFNPANKEHIHFGDVHDIGIGDKMAIAFLKTGATTSTMWAVAKSYYGSATNRWAVVGFGGTGDLTTLVQYSSTNYSPAWTDSPSHNDDVWRMYTSRVDRDGNLDIMVDGVIKASVSISSFSGQDLSTNYTFLIGAYNDTDGIDRHPTYNTWDGEIDEVWIFNTIKTDDWLVTFKNSVLGTFYTVGDEESNISTVEKTFTIKARFLFTRTKTISSRANIKGADGKIVTHIYAGNGDGNVAAVESSFFFVKLITTGTPDYISNTAWVGLYHPSSNDYQNYRGFFPFDTSILPDNIDLSSATIKFKFAVAQAYGTINTANSYLVVTESTQISTSSLVSGDYDSLNFTELSAQIDFDTISAPAYIELGLNSTGKALINKTGYTKLALTSGHDTQNTDPATIGDDTVQVYTSESVYPPQLIVEYYPTFTKTITSKSRIKDLGLTKSITAKARIQKSNNKTLTAKASIVIDDLFSKEDSNTLPTNANVLTTLYTPTEYSNVETDDNVYTEIIGQNYPTHLYRKVHTNNTANIDISVIVKTTIAPSICNVYLQIYNYNSASWETLDSDTSSNADTEFELTGSKTTNLSNYYDANNVVVFRVYQEVV